MTTEQDAVVVPAMAWKTLACVSAVTFMVSVEITIISLALEEIRSAFPGTSESKLSWIFTAYNIGVAALLLPASWLADKFGRRNIFVLGVALFGAGSLLASLAPSVNVLIAARVTQSIGGALQFPSGLALLLSAFPIEKRQLGIGIWGAAGGLAAAVGPPLGAFLVAAFGWQSVFFVNVPIAALIVAMGSNWLVRSDDFTAPDGVDLLSVPLASIGIGAIVLAIVQSDPAAWGWRSPWVAISAVTGLALVAVFVFRSRRHPEPLFDLGLFRLPSFTIGIIGQTAFICAFFAWLVPLPSFILSVWEWSELKTGLGIVPGPLTAMVVAPLAGRFADQIGPHVPLVIGGISGAVGALMFRLITSTEPNYIFGLLIPGILIGVAAGASFSGSVGVIMQDIQPRHYSMAGAGRQTMTQMAVALSIAVAFTIIGTNSTAQEHLDAIRIDWLMVFFLFVAEAVIFALVYPRFAGRGAVQN